MTAITRSLKDAHRLPVLVQVGKIPVLNIIVSPIHILIGTVQVVAGIAIGVFAGLGALITGSQSLKKAATDGGELILIGGCGIAISILNILTLGLWVLCVKK